MKKTLIAAVFGFALAACAGSSDVVTVNGASFDIEDIPIETAASTVDLDAFREALNWVIRDQVLMSSAADEFGISFPREELVEPASSSLASLSVADQQDPRANLEYFLIQARVGTFMLEGRLWPELESVLPEGVSPNQWAVERLSTAEVEVDPRFGEWQVSPVPGVYGP